MQKKFAFVTSQDENILTDPILSFANYIWRLLAFYSGLLIYQESNCTWFINPSFFHILLKIISIIYSNYYVGDLIVNWMSMVRYVALTEMT